MKTAVAAPEPESVLNIDPLSAVFAGSRLWADKDRVWRICDGLWQLTEGHLTVGVGDCASGLDHHVTEWFEREGLSDHLKIFVADWDYWRGLGRVGAAGPVRNKQMVEEMAPDIALAFFSPPPALNKGTKNFCMQAKSYGVAPFCYYETTGAR